jgi:hypothetical protein
MDKSGSNPPDHGPDARAAQEARKATLAEINREIPRLVEIAKALEKQLGASDLDRAFPSDLSKQARDLERLARQIRKHLDSL